MHLGTQLAPLRHVEISVTHTLSRPMPQPRALPVLFSILQPRVIDSRSTYSCFLSPGVARLFVLAYNNKCYTKHAIRALEVPVTNRPSSSIAFTNFQSQSRAQCQLRRTSCRGDETCPATAFNTYPVWLVSYNLSPADSSFIYHAPI